MRRWLSLRALGLGTLALLMIAAMVALGLWQLGAYDQHQAHDAHSRLQRPPTPLDRVLGPDAAFPVDGVGQPVKVNGRYLASEQIYVRGLAHSTNTYAATTPLLTRNGSVILVVRGSTQEVASPPPQGIVTVTGVLEPSSATGGSLSAERVTDGLRIASLLDGFSRDLYAGYVVLTASQPADPLPAIDPPLPDPSRWAGVRNLLYAVQWWVFAGFTGFMWWRIVRDLDGGPSSYDRPNDVRDADSVSSPRVG
jgi:surfeit locus 1 family protein